MGSSIYLFGGNGFLGKNLYNKFIENNKTPIIFDKSCNFDLLDQNDIKTVKNIISHDENHVIDIVLMAANLGVKNFNKNPFELYKKNNQIDLNCAEIIEELSQSKYIHVTYYSTSEVYGNMDLSMPVCMDKFKIDTLNSRQLYAYEKMGMEIILNGFLKRGLIESLRILRPFNVSGKYQQRGVVYDMVKSAIQEKKITYAQNVIREITLINDATDIAYEIILMRKTITANLTSGYCIQLEHLAQCIQKILLEDFNIENIDIEALPDEMSENEFIKTRGTQPCINDCSLFIEHLRKNNIIKDIYFSLKPVF